MYQIVLFDAPVGLNFRVRPLVSRTNGHMQHGQTAQPQDPIQCYLGLGVLRGAQVSKTTGSDEIKNA